MTARMLTIEVRCLLTEPYCPLFLFCAGVGFKLRPPGFRPQTAQEIYDMPDLFILQLVFERGHVILRAFTNTRKNCLRGGSIQPGLGVGKVGWRSTIEIASSQPLAILVMAFDTVHQVK